MKLLRSYSPAFQCKLQIPEHRSKNAFGRRRSDCDTSCTPSAIEKNLRYQTTDAVSDDYRRRFQFANDLLIMIDNFGQADSRKRARITAKLFDIAFPAGPVRGNYAITLVS